MRPTSPRSLAEIDRHATYARLMGRERSARDICLELKHEACLMFYGEISPEQFRARRNALIEAFRELRFTP